MTAHSTGQAPAAGPASTPTAVTDRPVADASKRRPSRPGEPTPWQRRTYSFGRYAVFAIPFFALIAGLLPRSSAAFSIDPTVYAHYLANGRWRPREASATIGLAVTGVLSIVGLASLLFRGRARGFALAGLAAGLAGSAGMLASVGSTVIRQDHFRHVVVDGHRQLAFNADTVGTGPAFLVIGGAVLLTLGWILLGGAVVRTSGMNRADGPLLMISTPLIFLGGMVVHVLPTMGSFLLLAAGLGIVVTAGRISIIGEDTWRQRRRRPAVALTASTAAATSGAMADAAAGMPLDRAAGLAGALGLARPQLFPERPAATAAIYHAPVASAAESSESMGSPAAGPSTPEPAAAANGGRPPAAAAHSNAAPGNEAGNGSAQNGNSAGDGPTPAGKSLRDLLRGARGAAAAWPVYRSRSGVPDSGNARDNRGQPGSRSSENQRNATNCRDGTTGRNTTNGRNTNGRNTNGRNTTNGRSGTNGRNGGRSAGRGGRSAKPTMQPPSRPATDKPDPPTGSPPARE
jgi:hypothetical protein